MPAQTSSTLLVSEDPNMPDQDPRRDDREKGIPYVALLSQFQSGSFHE